jgi:hypothetical protein
VEIGNSVTNSCYFLEEVWVTGSAMSKHLAKSALDNLSASDLESSVPLIGEGFSSFDSKRYPSKDTV